MRVVCALTNPCNDLFECAVPFTNVVEKLLANEPAGKKKKNEEILT